MFNQLSIHHVAPHLKFSLVFESLKEKESWIVNDMLVAVYYCKNPLQKGKKNCKIIKWYIANKL